MKKNSSLFQMWVVSLCILGILSSSCAPQESDTATVHPKTPSPPETTNPVTNAPTSSESAPKGAVQARLAMPEPPLLNKPVQLIATFTVNRQANKDVQEIDVKLTLPEGFQLVEGSLTGKARVSSDSKAQYQVTVKAVKTGTWGIEVLCWYPDNIMVGGIGGASSELYAIVSETNAVVTDIVPRSTSNKGIPVTRHPTTGTPATPIPRQEPPNRPLPSHMIPQIPKRSDVPKSTNLLLFNDPGSEPGKTASAAFSYAYYLVKVSKERMPFYGALTFRMLDQTGKELATTTAMVTK